MKFGFGRFLNNNIEEKDMDELFSNIPKPISEGMFKRDNYFHSCWVKLKHTRPDLSDELNRIELIVAGYNPDDALDQQIKEEDKDKTERIVL